MNRIALRIFVAATALAGVALTATGFASATPHDAPTLATLTLLAFAAELFAVQLFADSHVSVSGAALMAAAAIFGPWGVAATAPAIAVAGHLRCRRPLEKTSFNFGAYTLAGFAYIGVFRALGGDVHSATLPAFLVPATCAGLANMAVNSLLVAGAIGLNEHRSIVWVWRRNFAWLVPQYLVLAGVASGVALAGMAYGPWALALLALPALSLREALQVRVHAMKALDDLSGNTTRPQAAA